MLGSEVRTKELLLYKNREKWTIKQQIRAQLLFKEYPEIEKAYNLSQSLRQIYHLMQKLKHSDRSLEVLEMLNIFCLD